MRSRSDDPVARALTAATARILAAVRDTQAANPVVLIDGRSGAGKTSLSGRVAEGWPIAGGVQLIPLDALYPGWDGLEAGVERAREDILVPHARGMIGTWRRWDWVAEAEAESSAVDPSRGLIVEGCGILTARTAPIADVRVWVEAPPLSRRDRALTRDGDAYRPHWERWAAQEDAHIARDDPRSRADIVVAIP